MTNARLGSGTAIARAGADLQKPRVVLPAPALARVEGSRREGPRYRREIARIATSAPSTCAAEPAIAAKPGPLSDGSSCGTNTTEPAPGAGLPSGAKRCG